MKSKIISILSLITASTFAYAQAADSECWSEPLGYPCCQLKTTEIVFEEEATGYKFGVENDELCGITDLQLCPRGEKYKCCEKCNVYFVDDYLWGTQHGEWCSIKYSCEGKLVYKTTTTTTVADKPTAVEKTVTKTTTVAVKPTEEPQGGNPDPFAPQGSYPPPQGGYYPPQGGYPPPPPGGYYPPPQGGYYPPPQGGYYPPPQGGYYPPPPPPPPMYLGQPNEWCGGNGLPMICIYGYVCSLNEDNYYQCLEDPNPEETQKYLLQIFPNGIPGYPGYTGNSTIASTIIAPATTVKQTTIVEPTTTVEPTTAVESTTAVEPTTSVKPTTTVEPTTVVKQTTTVEPEETIIVIAPNTVTTTTPAPTPTPNEGNPNGMWGWGMFPPFFGDPNNGNGEGWNPVWTNPMFGNPWGFGNDNNNNNGNGNDNGNGENVPNLGDPNWGNTIWENPFIWGVGEDNGNGNAMPVWDPSIWGIPVWGDPSTWENPVIDVEPVTTNDNNKQDNNQDNQDLGIGPSGCVAFYYKCGGADFDGIKCCEPGSTCFQHNEYYYQCVPNGELYLYE